MTPTSREGEGEVQRDQLSFPSLPMAVNCKSDRSSSPLPVFKLFAILQVYLLQLKWLWDLFGQWDVSNNVVCSVYVTGMLLLSVLPRRRAWPEQPAGNGEIGSQSSGILYTQASPSKVSPGNVRDLNSEEQSCLAQEPPNHSHFVWPRVGPHDIDSSLILTSRAQHTDQAHPPAQSGLMWKQQGRQMSQEATPSYQWDKTLNKSSEDSFVLWAQKSDILFSAQGVPNKQQANHGTRHVPEK